MELRRSRADLITGELAERLLTHQGAAGEVEVSLDLGLTTKRCMASTDGILIGEVLLDWDTIRQVSKDRRGIYVVDRPPRKLAVADRHFYMLVATQWGHAPTLEIDGIHMHRVRDIFPEVDARMKVGLLGELRGRKVLDVCTGLGYTAIWAQRMGSVRILTIEKDPNVIEIAKYNPWSAELFEDKVELILGRAEEVLPRIRERFDGVVHDPPRLSLAGQLYGESFYRELARLMKTRAKLVHYVGQPGVRSGKRIAAGVMRRLRRAGFIPSYDAKTRCVVGVMA